MFFLWSKYCVFLKFGSKLVLLTLLTIIGKHEIEIQSMIIEEPLVNQWK